VIEVVSSGELADTAGGTNLPYLVFEYLDGITLRSALSAAGGVLALGRALHIVLQMSDAVGEAHELGIVHRDLKPENVMLVRRGDDPEFVKLLDFGLSRWSEADAGVETHAGAVLGTARYVSPEGARGEPVGPAADVYALATILFECLAGQPPFDGERPVAVLVKKSNEPAPELRGFARARDVPEPIASLLGASLSREPAQRPPNARAFGQALARAAAQGGIGADELLPRPTLFGARSSATTSPSALTRVLGTPSIPGEKLRATPARASFASGAETRFASGLEIAIPGVASPSALRRIGVILSCFVLGALAALVFATHVGACGK
jgi:serine/threonine protein kinase